MKTLLLVDGKNYAYRAFYAYSKLSHRGKGVSIIYGMTSMIGGLLRKFKPCKIIICWESDQLSKHRLRVHPEYKKRNTNRLLDFESFNEQLEYVQTALTLLGIDQVKVMGLEGDDVIYKMMRLAPSKGFEKTVIVSGDKDFNQLIRLDGSVTIYNENKKDIITTWNCKKIFGYNAGRTIDYLILTGDKSDNIPGYGGIGEKKAKDFIRDHNSISKFLAGNQEFRGIDREKLLSVVKRNRTLIDLRFHYEKFILGDKNYKNTFMHGKLNKLGFRKFMAKFNMQKLMGDGFIKVFE